MEELTMDSFQAEELVREWQTLLMFAQYCVSQIPSRILRVARASLRVPKRAWAGGFAARCAERLGLSA